MKKTLNTLLEVYLKLHQCTYIVWNLNLNYTLYKLFANFALFQWPVVNVHKLETTVLSPQRY